MVFNILYIFAIQLTQNKMINKVTKEEVLDAIQYLHTEGFVEEMSSDKQYYTEILLKKVANIYNINLGLD